MTEPILLFGIPIDFVFFALTLLGIALFHRRTLPIALAGLALITAYKLVFTGFKDGAGLTGLGLHLGHEFSLLANLFLLLMGFALLSRHFEESAIPDEMPALLPDDWKGGVVLLAVVFVLSSFLDNIAGAIIGGTVARRVFRGKVHIGYLAAIVAASNAGGSGSVVGDTTTTMMWVSGVSPLFVLEAYIAAVAAFAIFLMLMMVILFVLGMFLDWVGILLLTVPIFLPIMKSLRVDRIARSPRCETRRRAALVWRYFHGQYADGLPVATVWLLTLLPQECRAAADHHGHNLPGGGQFHGFTMDRRGALHHLPPDRVVATEHHLRGTLSDWCDASRQTFISAKISARCIGIASGTKWTRAHATTSAL